MVSSWGGACATSAEQYPGQRVGEVDAGVRVSWKPSVSIPERFRLDIQVIHSVSLPLLSPQVILA